MMTPFVKAHACGNDFLILEEAVAGRAACGAGAEAVRAAIPALARMGLSFWSGGRMASSFCGCSMRMGARRSFRGNGTRCVAAWLAQSEGLQEVALGTHGGVRTCRVIRGEGAQYLIESGMGVPRVMPRTIVVDGVGEVIDGAMVNVGNPHFVLFVESEDFSAHGMSWQELGAKIAVDPLFKFGTNVEFVRVRSADEIAFRIYRARMRADDFVGDGDVRFERGGDGAARDGAGVDGDCGGRRAADGVAGG